MPIDFPLPKFGADVPRVHRTPLVRRDQVIVTSGELFEDGRQRLAVSTDVSDETVAELERLLNERDDANDLLAKKIRAIEELMARAD